EVAGKDVEEDLEGIIERRIHEYCNYIEGFMHLNQRYDIWLRLSKKSFQKGLNSFTLIGKVLQRLFKSELPIIEKIQITFITDSEKVREMEKEARKIYEKRDARARGLKDEDVDTFYGCTLCQSFAPTHVCVITPERVSLCGATSWLDASMSYRLDPSGPNFPVPKGKCLNEVKGEWSGVNEEVKSRSHRATTKVYLHSMFEHPHTSCGCFQAVAFYIPEVDGIGIVDRSFRGVTVNGMAFSTMAGLCGGGKQVEGFLGIGIDYIKSRKFLIADGGLRRVVWMPRQLKERVKEAIPPELYAKIATEEEAKNLEELRTFLKKAGHPVVEGWKD
ncbi:TPA: CO dehydrogenase/CO-methylating acetyl-CoA synthase complex subunit beta, partial [Candidatus Bathyarchaeota archaeon]|nr:CO dehydrogenase/CO-methylating acetyl-CoA synthase complex subunit beta [Candidatus Bathyarchaeota archaeon]